MELSLSASVREGSGKIAARKLRNNGQIPAILYGEGQPTESISVSNLDLQRLISKHGTSKLIKLKVDQGKTEVEQQVLIKEIKNDPLLGKLLHLDFLRVAMNHEITLKVGVHLLNEDKRVRDGAVIEHNLHELEICCLPGNLPEQISVDVSKLVNGTAIYVKNLKLPEGIKAVNSPEEIVVRAVAPKVEVAEENKEPEVVGAKK